MKNPAEMLWRDQADVYRVVPVVINNITKSSEEQVGSAIKCQYTQGSITTTDEATGAPVVNNAHKLICGISADIKEGDRVSVLRVDGSRVNLRIGEGFVYPDHLEFKVERNDTA